MNGVEYSYLLEGTKIVREMRRNGGIYHHMFPIYDHEDSVCGFEYDDVPYYFVKNLQGDVIAITNKDGGVIARYTYDAWGKVVSAVTDTEATAGVDIANINPYRYRSYYYDTETGLYYLQSRYYDPETGRFVNADDMKTLVYDGKFEQQNLYAYCANSPVNEIDTSGTFLLSKVIKSVLSAIGEGLLSQFYADMVDFAYDCLALGKNNSFKFSNSEDYAYAILSALIDELTSVKSIVASFVLFIKLAGIAAKYLWKLVRGRMQNKDWGTLVLDVISVLVEHKIKNLKKAHSSKIKSIQKKKKNSRNLERKLQQKKNSVLQMKVYYCNISLKITLPVSTQLLNFMLKVIFR